jgi:PEP-CTERM motif
MARPARGCWGNWMCGWIAAAVIVAAAGISRAALMQGMQMNTAGMPTGASPDGNMNQYAVTVYYFLNGTDPSGGLGQATIPVPNIPATAGLPTPTAAQVAAGSAAKANAIVMAINNAKLPGVMAAVDADTVSAQYPTGMTEEYTSKLTGKTYPRAVMGMADFTTYTVSGVRQSINLTNQSLGSAVTTGAVDGKGKPSNTNVTQEVSNATGNFKANNGARGMLEGTDTGTGALASAATGVDGSGDPSIVGFGFVDETGSSPVYYTESLEVSAGMTDSDVDNSLVDMFDSDYESLGYTLSYDSSDDTLSTDQELPAVDEIWSSDSDTGLDIIANTEVPEPASLSVLAIGGAALMLRRRRTARGA